MSSIVFFSHTARAGDFRVGSHHLSSAFAASGHRVAHISTPFSWAHAILKPGQKARRAAAFAGPVVADGVTDLIPTPILPANIVWTPAQTRRALAKVGIPQPDFVFVDQPLFPVTHFGAATVVFRPTDIFPTDALQALATTAAQKADGVVATSPGVLASVMGDSDRPSRVLENGVEFTKFAAAAAAGHPKEYDFVYVGALDFRFDFEVLAHAARALPDSQFAIFGPSPAAPLDLPSNVHLRGSVAYESVPDVMARGRIGLMPFVDNPSNSARSPMKLYEYVAAGVPVVVPAAVAARVPDLHGLTTYTAGDAASFVDALVAALAEETSPSDGDRETARKKDWGSVAGELLEFTLACKVVS